MNAALSGTNTRDFRHIERAELLRREHDARACLRAQHPGISDLAMSWNGSPAQCIGIR